MTNTYTSNHYIVRNIFSKYLHHDFEVRILLPPGYGSGFERFPVLYLNDGQDLEKLNLPETLESLYRENKIQQIIIVAICAVNRMEEYGTSSREDFKGRGSLAERYGKFIIRELMPVINHDFYTLTDANTTAFAGFSLGALSAFDMVWNYPNKFSKAGIFSGSLWWRRKDLDQNYSENNDRILINMIKRSKKRDGIKFWFQTGTHDETYDRNNNGVIDSIDDTIDVINCLKKIGYNADDISYFEVMYGQHDFGTWSYAMPVFLCWAFGK